MIKYYKKLNKGWKLLISICGALAAIAGGIKGYHVIHDEVSQGIKNIAKPYIIEQSKIVVQDELEYQKTRKKTGYRFRKAQALGIPIDSLLSADRAVYVAYQQNNLDKAAFQHYLKTLSMYVWRELEIREHNGVEFGYSERTSLVFYMYHGYIFEAYYKGSTRSYWFKDAYGIEQECK